MIRGLFINDRFWVRLRPSFGITAFGYHWCRKHGFRKER
jgi:hypothetical protein